MDNERLLSRKELALLLSLFVAALLVRLYFIPFYRVISADGVGYVGAARALLKGNFSPLTTYGVVYPTLTAAVSLLGPGTEMAGRLVSAVMGSLLVFPLYLLGREFFPRKVGTIACILVIAWPSLRSWAGEVMTQGSYITLLVTWYWLLWRAFRHGSAPWAVAAGAVAGLSYLTRPESVVAFAVMAPVLLLSAAQTRTPGRRLVLLAACTAAFVAMLLPFLILVHNVTGQWQITGKGGATLADALSEYLGRPDLKHEPQFSGMGFMDVIRSYPDFLRANFLKNLKLTMETMVPWYLWAAAAIGFIAGQWRKEQLIQRAYLLGSFAPLGIIVMFFFVGPEYLQPYLPVLFLWAGNGMSWAEQRLVGPLAERKGMTRWAEWSPVSLLAVSVLTIGSFIGQIPADRNKPYHYDDDGGRFDHRRIGELLKQHLPPGSKIMTRWGRISFYAELENVGMPQTDLMEMVNTARNNGVNYIIADGMLMGMRPQFQVLFAPLMRPPDAGLFITSPNQQSYSPVSGLRLHLLYKDPSSLGVAVYEIIR